MLQRDPSFVEGGGVQLALIAAVLVLVLDGWWRRCAHGGGRCYR